MKLISEKFMFNNQIGFELFEKIAKKLPIIDFHCHLNPQEIYEDKPFENISQIWLYGDHYKWRLMRFHGILEENITGKGNDQAKFFSYAQTIEDAIGNPLYHWSALELSKYFDVNEVLTSQNWKTIYDQANKCIIAQKLSPVKLINSSNVELICTTDNPYDNLKWHRQIKELTNLKAKVVPGFRPDDLWYIGQKRFNDMLSKLEKKFNVTINNYADLISVLERAIIEFKELGSCISDHGFNLLEYVDTSKDIASAVFDKNKNNLKLSNDEVSAFITQILVDLSGLYIKHKFVMQFHFGAIRNNNDKMFDSLGVDTGFDVINHQCNLSLSINKLLNKIYYTYTDTPKMIFFNLDSTFNKIVPAILNNFQINTKVHGKIQFGAAWWFNDTETGMIDQLTNFAQQSVLGDFVGMLTDSRSFVSYARHEYFRRILCNFIGEQVTKNKLPNDFDYLSKIVKKISYENAKSYFARNE